MNKNPFYLFHESYLPNKEFIPFDIIKHEKYISKAPEDLLTEWKEFGFRGYNNGLIWTCDPNESILSYEDWPPLDGSGFEIMRTAFGDVCTLQNNEFLWLNIYSGRTTNFDPDPDIHFNYTLINKDFRTDFLMEKLFKTALKKLGPLSVDECYGFAPIPALGGAMKKEYLIKVKMREYISILSQA